MAPRAAHLWSEINPHNAPPGPGCYAIFQGTALVYLGSGLSVRRRLNDHGIGRSWKRPLRRWSTAAGIRVKMAGPRRRFDWLSREARLISRLSPSGNVLHARPSPGPCV